MISNCMHYVYICLLMLFDKILSHNTCILWWCFAFSMCLTIIVGSQCSNPLQAKKNEMLACTVDLPTSLTNKKTKPSIKCYTLLMLLVQIVEHCFKVGQLTDLPLYGPWCIHFSSLRHSPMSGEHWMYGIKVSVFTNGASRIHIYSSRFFSCGSTHTVNRTMPWREIVSIHVWYNAYLLNTME